MSGQIHIAVYPSRGRGWVSLRFVGETWPAGCAQLRVLHWGHKKPYLGSKGWQVAEAWCDVEVEAASEGGSMIALPPVIAAMMEQGDNYRLAVRIGQVEVFDRGLMWRVSSSASPLPDNGKSTSKVDADLFAHRSTSPAPGLGHPETQGDGNPTDAKPHGWDASAADDAAKRWQAAKLGDTRSGYQAFLVAGGEFFEQAQHELAHFLPDQILVRTSSTNSSGAFRLDTCIFLLNENQQVRSDRDFICWFATEHVTGASLKSSSCEAVINLGHSQPMQRALTSESIQLQLNALPAEVHSVAFTLSLDPTAPLHRGLEAVEFAVTEIVDMQTKQTLLAIDFAKGQFGLKGLYLAELVRRGEDWKLVSRGETFVGGLDAICARFGIAVE